MVRVTNHTSALILILVLEKLKGTESFWWPYLNILPETYDTLYFWTPEEIDELQSSLRGEEIASSQVARRSMFPSMLEVLRRHQYDSSALSEELYMWAHAIVASRCFEYNATVEHMLIPMADLLNHHYQSPTAWKQEDEKFVMFVRGGGFEKGTQVYNNYGGDQDNFRMLQDYGFIPFDNDMNNKDKFYVPSLSEKKQRVWDNRDYVWLFWNMRPLGLLKFFRVVSATDEELPDWKAPSRWSWEQKAARTCVRVIRDHVESLPTKLDKDFELLRTSKGRKRLAILFRIARKRILLRTAEFCQHLMDHILSCIAPATVRRPIYMKMVIEATEHIASKSP